MDYEKRNCSSCGREIERPVSANAEKPELYMPVHPGEVRAYLRSLEKIVRMLPLKPPRYWTEKRFAYAKALTEIIRLRLSKIEGVA
ncbi:MAG: hypothetical protein ABSG85_14575 [Spirochaetia bacterium]|jgi:hypothetical protein